MNVNYCVKCCTATSCPMLSTDPHQNTLSVFDGCTRNQLRNNALSGPVFYNEHLTKPKDVQNYCV